MRKLICAVSMILFFLIPTLAQEGLANRLAGSEALFSRLPGIWAAEAYNAALASQKNMMAGSYGEKRFMTDLSVFNLMWSGLLVKLPMQVSVSREGTTAFSHTRFVVTAGKKLGKLIQLGVNAGYTGYHARGYDPRGEINAGAGALLQLTENCRFGIQLNHQDNVKEKNEVRFSFRSGFGYSLSQVCSITIEISKEPGKPAVTDVSIFYAFHPEIYARTGYCPALSLVSFCLGYQHGKYRAEMGQAIHLSLGATCGLSIMYRFKDAE